MAACSNFVSFQSNKDKFLVAKLVWVVYLADAHLPARKPYSSSIYAERKITSILRDLVTEVLMCVYNI